MNPRHSSVLSSLIKSHLFHYCLILALALTCAETFAQSSILDKPVTLSLRNTAISEVLSAIQQQTGCTFSYSPSAINSAKKVNVSYQRLSLREAITRLLGNRLRIQVDGNQIYLQPANDDKGTVRGTVTTANGQPAAYVNVHIAGVKSVSTDDKGDYLLKDILTGTYGVTASFIGYITQTQNVTIAAGDTQVLNFVLAEDAKELQTVEVTGRKQSSYKNDNSFSAGKIEMPVKDIPQSISSITKEFIKDRQAIRLNEVVQNVAGVNQFSNYDDITMRGFRNAGSNGRLLNGLRTINIYGTSPLLVNIEKIEFIKGPASALFANTNPGGTINMVTKKPLDEARQSVSFTTGSFNTLRMQADATGPLNADKTLLYRLNVGVENADTYRKNIVNNSVVVAPSISFLPKPGTRFNADFVYTKGSSQFDNGRPIINGSTDVLALPMNLNTGQPNDYDNFSTYNLTLSFSQKITDNLNFNASYLRSKFFDDSGIHGLNDYITPDSVSMAYGAQTTRENANSLTTYFTFKGNTGSVSHTLLAGFDHVDDNYLQYYKTAIGNQDGVSDFSLIRPLYLIQPIEQYKYRPENINNYGARYFTNGVYVQDLIKYKRLQFLLSLRQEFYIYPKTDDASVQGLLAERRSQKALLPRIGVTYGLTDNISIYGTYNTGFEAQDSYSISAPGAGGPFDPLTTNLFEAGAKGEFLNKRLFGGIAVYQIIQNNVLVSANDISQPNLLIQRGQERSRGIELETGGYITPNLSVQLSYAYNRAIITKSTEGDLDGQVGLTKEGAPKNVSGSWIKYSIRSGSLKGLGFGAGHSQVSSKETYDRTLQIPGYVIFNSAAYYNVDRFQLSANVNNLTDKRYLIGGFSYFRTFPAAPRNYFLNVAYTF